LKYNLLSNAIDLKENISYRYFLFNFGIKEFLLQQKELIKAKEEGRRLELGWRMMPNPFPSRLRRIKHHGLPWGILPIYLS